jgi:hypothetical protein
MNIESDRIFKYEEDKTLKIVVEYIESTYDAHYTSENSKFQLIDLFDNMGDALPYCRTNAIKYLYRLFDKGNAKQDLLKAIHYCILLYHYLESTPIEPELHPDDFEKFMMEHRGSN